MDNLSTIRVELGINAQRFVQQVAIHNSTIEAQIEKGINLALEEISQEDVFVIGIKNETLRELKGMVSQRILSWELKQKLQKSIEEKIGKKLDEYAETIATKIVDALK